MRNLTLLTAAILLSSCATTLSHRHESIDVTSASAGAAARIDCADATIPATPLPARIQLPRKAQQCRVVVSKPGAADQTFELRRVTNRRIWWNLLPGAILGIAAGSAAATDELLCDNPDGCGNDSNTTSLLYMGAGTALGMLVDHWTGAMYRHEPARVEAK